MSEIRNVDDSLLRFENVTTNSLNLHFTSENEVVVVVLFFVRLELWTISFSVPLV